jgi:dTDP-glucose 4,6-dehydratase
MTITDPNMERYMMTIPDACELVIEAATKGKAGEVYILDMGKPVNIMQLAQEIIANSGQAIETKIIGIRPGEMLNERLMTEEEEKVAIKEGKFYVLR